MKLRKPITKLTKEDLGYNLDHSLAAIAQANRKGAIYKAKAVKAAKATHKAKRRSGSSCGSKSTSTKRRGREPFYTYGRMIEKLAPSRRPKSCKH